MNMNATWDYFFDIHNWDGHDGKGAVCNVYVNVGVNWRMNLRMQSQAKRQSLFTKMNLGPSTNISPIFLL